MPIRHRRISADRARVRLPPPGRVDLRDRAAHHRRRSPTSAGSAPDRGGHRLVWPGGSGRCLRNSLAPTRLRVGWSSRLALRPTIPARERFYANTRLARRGNAPSRQTGSTAGLVPFSKQCAARALSPIVQEGLTHASLADAKSASGHASGDPTQRGSMRMPCSPGVQERALLSAASRAATLPPPGS